jgi:hypothetical protein
MKKCEDQNEVDLREFFNTKIENVLTLIRGNDENYKTQFANAKESVTTALTAQEKAVAAAFLASEKAIVKAEDAQKDYNQRSNEFRGQLDDQAKTLMPRQETIGLLKAIDDKFAFMQSTFESRIEAQRVANEKVFDALTKDIASLRESRSEGTGKSIGLRDFWGYLVALGGIATGILVIILHK